ncbi:protein DCL homolog, chloroplastic [Juglans microcarpa x Juglans regia]|uniref:protein DCL homolog, chloroplastic n=1 Tax=Juglans microcarpa x Juglans regia TaxID=2249226 RepID=UPI001B7DD011|nr:protein DCL homolog, chloroplastic [Juglans microcarpa x Juglans regia]
MASISKPPPRVHLPTNPSPLHFLPVILSFPSFPKALLPRRLRALRTGPDGYGSELLRKPVVSQEKDSGGISDESQESEEGKMRDYEEKWVDWEDRILEDTVPLVGFVRMIIHSGIYQSGDRLSAEHETTILERLLPFHPEFEKKIGCGIDYITIGYHPEFERSRCLFIVRKDGELVDFSYWKCIKGLIKKNYPLYADSFILRHFQKHRRSI